MPQFADRVKVTSTSTGTGAITLSSTAVSGYQAFPSSLDGETVGYVIESGSAWEIGTGVYTHSSLQLSRSLRSSSTGSLLSLASGTHTVFLTPAFQDIQIVEAFSSTSDLPSASDNHGRIYHVHGEGAMYFAHGGSWYKMANYSDIVTYSNATTSAAGLMSAADKTKLDGVEASADVTDTTNVVAALTAGTNITIAADGTISSSAGGISGVTVQDEGTALSTAATTLNFAGAGVQATGTGATKTITISGSSISGTLTDPVKQTEFTGSATTTFTVDYTVGSISVFLNGAKLAASDFTATNGTSVVLGSACAASDIVTVVEYGTPFSSPYSSTVFTVGTSSEYNTSTKVLTTNYTANKVAVFLNGVKLLSGTDYTASNGTTIDLTNSSPSTSDKIEVVEHGALAESGSGSGVTTYTAKSGTDGTPAGATYIDNASSPSEGDLAYDLAADQLYIRTTSAWKRVSIGVDESPIITTEPASTHILNSDGSTSTVTMVATDPEGFGITYGIAYPTANNALPDQLATATSINQSTGVYTFNPSTTEADAGNVKVRLSASDGISTTTRFCTLFLFFSEDITTPNSAPFTQAGTNTANCTFSSATSSTGMGFSSELSTGKKYFEVVNAQGNGQLNGYGMVGLCDNTVTSLGYNVTGFQGMNNQNSHIYPGNTDIGFANGDWNQTGDVLMIAYDTSTREVWFGINGTWYQDPATTSSSFLVGTSSTTSFKMAFGSSIGGGSSYNNQYNIITGSQTLNYSVPSGFAAH